MRPSPERRSGMPGEVILFRQTCALCEERGVAKVKTVRFFRRGLAGEKHGDIVVEIKRGPQSCDDHRDEVVFRAVWNVYQKEVAPPLLKAGREQPTEWEVFFDDGRHFGGPLPTVQASA
jgi:hypothetical protein